MHASGRAEGCELRRASSHGRRTTGIFTRPSCRAKKPAENVQFFFPRSGRSSPAIAPCLRCKPPAFDGDAPGLGQGPARPGGIAQGRASSRISRTRSRDGLDPAARGAIFRSTSALTFQAYSARATAVGRALSATAGVRPRQHRGKCRFESLGLPRRLREGVRGACGKTDRAKAIHLGWVKRPSVP